MLEKRGRDQTTRDDEFAQTTVLKSGELKLSAKFHQQPTVKSFILEDGGKARNDMSTSKKLISSLLPNIDSGARNNITNTKNSIITQNEVEGDEVDLNPAKIDDHTDELDEDVEQTQQHETLRDHPIVQRKAQS